MCSYKDEEQMIAKFKAHDSTNSSTKTSGADDKDFH